MPNPETEEKICEAAFTLFAERGFADTTIRQIAKAAEVSPGLVIHYFGSKDKLRAACDRYLAELIRARKEKAAEQGVGFDAMAALREVEEGPPLTRYLVRAFAEGSPGGAELYDQLVNDAVGYTESMVESGMMRPTENPFGRAVVLTTWSLGALVLHEHLNRLLGVDLLATPSDPKAGAAYMGPVLDIQANGVLTPEFAELLQSAFVKGDSKGEAHNE